MAVRREAPLEVPPGAPLKARRGGLSLFIAIACLLVSSPAAAEDWPPPAPRHRLLLSSTFGLSYNALNGPLMLTPFVGGVAPSHGYEYFAHAAAGRQLKELQAGVALSVLLNRILPGVFFDSRYSFGFVEQNVSVRPNHSNLDLQAGYFVTPSLRVFFLSAGQWSHDGIDVTIPVTLPADVFAHHDQIDRVHYLKIGGGASFELTDSMSVYGAFSKQVAGRNGHEVYRAISVGMTWSFRTKKETLFGTTAAAPAAPASPVAWSPYPQRAGM